MEPTSTQFEPQRGLPEKPRSVTLSELRPDPATGRYTATKPGNVDHQVDTKAELSSIRADRLEDNEKSAAARKIINDNSAEIEKMRKSTPASRYYEKVLQKSTEQRQKRIKYRGQ